MLAYAAHRRQNRQVQPATLALIIGAHVAAVGLLATVKMDVGPGKSIVDTVVRLIPAPVEEAPPPPPAQQRPAVEQPRASPQSHVDQPRPSIPLDSGGPAMDIGLPTTDIVPDVTKLIEAPLGSVVSDPPTPSVVRVAAEAITPAEYLRPPYPDSKRRTEEEAVLRLKLQIDQRGRVVDVAPVGTADPDFLSSARRHLMRYWRYRPATEDGRAVPTSITITLRFQLED